MVYTKKSCGYFSSPDLFTVTGVDWGALNCFAGRSDWLGTAITNHNALFWVHSSIHLIETLKDRLDRGERITHRMTCISTQKPKCGKKWHPMSPILHFLKKKKKHIHENKPFKQLFPTHLRTSTHCLLRSSNCSNVRLLLNCLNSETCLKIFKN